MPCNLAVTITRTTIAADHLRHLLTAATIEPVVLAYLRDRLAGCPPTASVRGSTLLIRAGEYTITITADQVSVASASATGAEQLVEELTAVLAALADELFAAELSAVLSPLGAATQQVVVDNAGVQQTAYQFTFEL